MSKKISFIIPAYNAEKYIEKCVSEILLLKYDNFDVIVVDDGSKDKTAEILSSLSSPRLKVVHQKNAGVSAARNTGIANSDADYAVFIDADDILIAGKLDEILSRISFDKDIYMFSYEHEENGSVRKMPLPLSPGDYNKETIEGLAGRLVDLKFAKNYKSSYFGAKIYQYIFSLDFIRKNGICFPTGIHFAEDCVFCYTVFRKAQSLSVIDITAYHYIVYPGSASHRYRRDFWNEIKAFYNTIKNINGGDIANKSGFFYYYFTDIIEKAMTHVSDIGKAEAMKVINGLFSDTEYQTAAASVSFSGFTAKEKILLSFYKKKKAAAAYCFFDITLKLRKLKKRFR